MRRVVLTFVIALGVGGVAGYFLRSSAKEVREVETKRALREEAREAKVWGREELVNATLGKIRKDQEPGRGPLADRLADWSTDEIRAALEESAKSPDALFGGTPGASAEHALMREWMRRDHKEAVAWFEALESDYVKSRLVLTISAAWPVEDAMASLDFYTTHRALYGEWKPTALHKEILNQAAAGGPAAVEEMLRRFREDKISLQHFSNLEFPAGFDFRTLVAGEEFRQLEEKGGSAALIRAWSDKDPAGAFAWLMEKGGMIRVSTMTRMQGSHPEQRLKWLGGEMSGWTAERREELIGHSLSSWKSEPEALKHLAEGAKDPAVAEQLRAMSIQSIYSMRTKQALEVLGTIPEPARRIELLMAAERYPSETGRAELMTLRPSSVETLTNTLRGWNATPEQIEAILQRFNP